jgi:hypothetical protein
MPVHGHSSCLKVLETLRSVSRLAPSRQPFASASLRFLELEHEFVGRLGRRLRGEIAGILGMVPEIALAHELETGRLDLTAQRALLDAVKRLPDRGAGAGGCRMVT